MIIYFLHSMPKIEWLFRFYIIFLTLSDGDLVGSEVGFLEGAADGSRVGFLEGVADGEGGFMVEFGIALLIDSDRTGSLVGEELGGGVGDAIRSGKCVLSREESPTLTSGSGSKEIVVSLWTLSLLTLMESGSAPAAASSTSRKTSGLVSLGPRSAAVVTVVSSMGALGSGTAAAVAAVLSSPLFRVAKPIDKPRMKTMIAPAMIHPVRLFPLGALANEAVEALAMLGVRPDSSSSRENDSPKVSTTVSVVLSR